MYLYTYRSYNNNGVNYPTNHARQNIPGGCEIAIKKYFKHSNVENINKNT